VDDYEFHLAKASVDDKELISECKNSHPEFLTKFFISFLLVIRFILRTFLHFYLWFTLIALVVKTVTSAQYKCQDAEHLQVK
jgi:hypothetical protein